MKRDKIIEQLKDDELYYGEFGKQFLSNSDLKYLKSESSAKEFRSTKKFSDDQMKNLELGKYFHQLLLEPDKAKDFAMVDVKTRASKEYKQYKEDNNVDFVLRTSEAQEIKDLADWVMNPKSEYGSDIVRALLNNPIALKEQPAIAEIHGHMFKGKADLITLDVDGQYVIVDLKTTGSNPSDINIFRMRDFGYDSQCYLYKQLFGMDFKFVFFGKKKKINNDGDIYYDIEEITPSDQTLEGGKMAVMSALANYDKFFGEGATHDVRKSYTRRVI